ncbi:hypothetical protein [Thioalkalivibrio sp.]|uniref:hypothetical protein n=1 Tax=Thioalkalivibrio sp. TaxID=2093813 RepID=UPI0039751897
MRISNEWLMSLAVPAMLVCSAAKAVELGPVAGWEAGAADVVVFGTEKPEVVGAIDAQGRVEVALPAAVEPEQTFAESFSCPYEGETSISAPDAKFATWSSLLIARMAEEELIGELKAFSSPVYAEEWRAALGAGDNAPEGGSSFNWIYVSEPVRVEGVCDVDFQIDGSGTAPVKRRTEYAMEFDAGWQFLESETRATVTSQSGVTWAVDTLMRSAAQDSDRINWVVFLER